MFGFITWCARNVKVTRTIANTHKNTHTRTHTRNSPLPNQVKQKKIKKIERKKNKLTAQIFQTTKYINKKNSIPYYALSKVTHTHSLCSLRNVERRGKKKVNNERVEQAHACKPHYLPPLLVRSLKGYAFYNLRNTTHAPHTNKK